MQLLIRDCSVEQPTNGYKKFLKYREKTQRPSSTEASKKQDKNHKQLLSKHWSGRQKRTYNKLGIPSRVASSVVQDNTPNNLGLGVTNILIHLQTI